MTGWLPWDENPVTSSSNMTELCMSQWVKPCGLIIMIISINGNSWKFSPCLYRIAVWGHLVFYSVGIAWKFFSTNVRTQKFSVSDGNLDPNPAIQCIGLLDPNCLVSEGKHFLYTTSLQIGIQNSSKWWPDQDKHWYKQDKHRKSMNTIWNAVVPGSSSQAEPQTSKKGEAQSVLFLKPQCCRSQSPKVGLKIRSFPLVKKHANFAKSCKIHCLHMIYFLHLILKLDGHVK